MSTTTNTTTSAGAGVSMSGTTSAARRAIDARLDATLAASGGQSGGVGFVGPDVPIEILLASGRPFGHLPWRATEAWAWADEWLESSFPYWARSILEQWHDGVFDALDTVVFSRADDASQRLYYYVAELKRRGKLGGPAAHMFDVAHVPRETSLAHTEAAILALMHVLDVDARALPAAVERANALRRAFAAIESGRAFEGPLYERLGRAALWSDSTRWIDEVVSPAESETAAAAPVRRARILLAGSMPVDERLHAAVENAGVSVVAEAHALAAGRLGPAMAAAEEPLPRSIARHLRQVSVAPRAFFARAERLVDRARSARADAVILWLTREDEALAWAVPAARRALAAAGIAAFVLPAARWQADDGALERVVDFSRSHAHATA
jgi:hypothetical protein